MAKQGFKVTALSPYSYEELASGLGSSACGIDNADAKFKIATATAAGAVVTTNPQLIIDPAVNGDITVAPHGDGNINLNQTATGAIIAANTYGKAVGATTQTMIIDSTGKIGSSASPAGTVLSVTAGTGINLTGTAANPVVNLTIPVTVPFGGSGAITLTGILTGNGASPFTASTVTQYGTVIAGASNTVTSVTPSTTGFVLTSNGAGANPSYQSVSAGGATTSIQTTPATGTATPVAGVVKLAGGTTGLVFTAATDTVTTTFAGITANGGTVSMATDATVSTINVGTGAAAKTSTFGSASSTSATTVQSGTGALNVTSANGALTINSGTGTLSIGNDATAQSVNLATGAGAKTVTIGSTTTTSSLALKYGTSDFSMASATGTTMTALDSGEISFPLQPAFLAYMGTSDSNVTGNGTTYTLGSGNDLTEEYDQGSNFDHTSGVFTAPASGVYNFFAVVKISGITSAMTSYNANIVTTAVSYSTTGYPYGIASSANICSIQMTVTTQMTAGQTCYFTVQILNGAGNTADVISTGHGTYFCGYKVA